MSVVGLGATILVLAAVLWIIAQRRSRSALGDGRRSPTASRFVSELRGALEEAGVAISGITPFHVELLNGRQLPIGMVKARYAAAESEATRRKVLEDAVSDWSLMGHVLPLAMFRDQVVEALTDAGLQPHLDRDDPYKIHMGTGALLLGRVLRDCQALPAGAATERIAELVVQARLASERPASYEAIADEILPRIVTASRIDWDEQDGRKASCVWLSSGLAARVAVSRSGVHRYLDDHLEVWQVSFGDALLRALENQAAMGLPLHRCKEAQGALLSKFVDHRDANIFLLPDEAFDQLALAGAPVVFAIAEDLVFVTGSHDHDGLRVCLQEALDGLREQARPLHPAPLIRVGLCRWERFQPDARLDQEFTNKVRWLHQVQSLRECQATRELMLRRFPGVFVAEPETHGPDHELETWATWPPLEAVLPDAAWIAVVDESRAAHLARAADVRRLAARVLTRVDGLHTPWWYASSGFPAEALPELRAISRPLGRLGG